MYSAACSEGRPFEDPRPEVRLEVDYGYGWPMSTIFWDPKGSVPGLVDSWGLG